METPPPWHATICISVVSCWRRRLHKICQSCRTCPANFENVWWTAVVKSIKCLAKKWKCPLRLKRFYAAQSRTMYQTSSGGSEVHITNLHGHKWSSQLWTHSKYDAHAVTQPHLCSINVYSIKHTHFIMLNEWQHALYSFRFTQFQMIIILHRGHIISNKFTYINSDTLKKH